MDVDYNKPLKNNKHERFSQEYIVKLVVADAYKIAYPKASQLTAEQNGSKLLKNIKVVGRIAYLQAKLSEKSGVTAKMLMDEWAKIGFANVKDYVDSMGKPKKISLLTVDQAAAISSITITKLGLPKIVFHSKETALENMGKMIGAYEKDNSQKKESLAEFLKVMKN